MNCGQTHLIPLPPAGDESQTTRLADELAMAIHLGRMSPGQPLREVELAEAHNVSRTIVRAALQRLEAQGLAEITLNKGARVRRPDADAVDDLIELHVQLATLAARNAAWRATSEQVNRIEDFVSMMEHLAEEMSPAEEFQHLRIGFARALYNAAGPVLAERLRSAAPATPYHERAMDDLQSRDGRQEAAKAARDVLRAIESKQAEAAAAAAERMLRRHAERTLTRRAAKTLV